MYTTLQGIYQNASSRGVHFMIVDSAKYFQTPI